MTRPLFDARQLPLRHARASKLGGDYFLHERTFDECLDRISTVRRTFDRGWILGLERPTWHDRLIKAGVGQVVHSAIDGTLPEISPDLCLSIGSFDTADDLPGLLTVIRHILSPGGLLIGAFAGGQSLPELRRAMAEADQLDGVARPHFHPMIAPASFGDLLSGAGFVDPVIDVDRVTLSYQSMGALVDDLRAMAATNRLIERSRGSISRAALNLAEKKFSAGGARSRTEETIEIIYFAAWTPINS